MLKNILCLFYLVSFCLILFSCSNNSNSSSPNSTENEAINAAAIYKQYCVLCHGAKGNLGLNGAADLSKSSLTKAEKIEVISKGRNLMAPYGNILTEKEISVLADYVLNLNMENNI